MDQFKPRWGATVGASMIFHSVMLSVIALVISLIPAAPVQKDIIEVDLVSGGGGGGGGGSSLESAPDIKPPEATPTAPPPPPPQVPDETVPDDVHEMTPPVNTTPMPPASYTAPAAPVSSSGGSGIGSGGGSGSGTGSGTGPGSGSGSGGGDGSGVGSGTGSGMGSGNGETMGPQILSNPKPNYPSSARLAGIEGTVGIGLIISAEGIVTSAWVIESSGNGDLDQAAVEGVYRWQFVPAKQNGVPIEVKSSVPVTFRLR